MSEQYLKILECRADFYAKFYDALEQAGGSFSPQSVERYQMMSFYELVDILAQNGLRITFNPDWHMDPESFEKNNEIE